MATSPMNFCGLVDKNISYCSPNLPVSDNKKHPINTHPQHPPLQQLTIHKVDELEHVLNLALHVLGLAEDMRVILRTVSNEADALMPQPAGIASHASARRERR
eukprot:338596-Hanusia_phi.AAC.5